MRKLFANAFRRSRIEQDLDEELRFCVEELTDEKIRSGMAPDAARRAANIQFGGVEQVKELVRDGRPGAWFESLWRDLRYGARDLWKHPGFTLAAVVSLALGIGAATAVYSVIYAALFNAYPYPAVDRIVRLTLNDSNTVGDDWLALYGSQVRRLQRFLKDRPIADSVMPMGYEYLTLTGRDLPESVVALRLTPNAFADLGIPPTVGRAFLPSDAIDGQDPQPVAVLSHRFWAKEFSSDPNVVGKVLRLNRSSYTVVGVESPRFTWYNADVYLPIKLTTPAPGPGYFIDLRLKPGVTHGAANAALQPLMEQFAKEIPNEFPERFRVEVVGLNQWFDDKKGTLFLLFAAVMLLLAIGCANVSILLLARGTARQRELAVRVAVGADGRRLVRQLLTESLLLAVAGVALGVLMSYGILTGLATEIRTWLPSGGNFPQLTIRMDLPVLLFSGATALVTTLLFGLWPALRISRAHRGQLAKSNERQVGGGMRGRGTHGVKTHGLCTHGVLVGGQIALILVLLAGAGSAAEGFLRLLHKPLGFDPHYVLSLGIPHGGGAWAVRAAYFEQIRAKISETPEVTQVAISGVYPPPQDTWDTHFEIPGSPAVDQETAAFKPVSREYFAVLRIPILQGRIWNETENQKGARVAVINRTLARRYFPNGNAIGRSIRIEEVDHPGPDAVVSPMNAADPWLPIVGIVGDTLNNHGLRNPVKPEIYVPFTATVGLYASVLIRTEAPPLSLLRAVRAQVARVDPEQHIWLPSDLESLISNQPEMQQERIVAWIIGILAALALGLGAVGLYSVVSYSVTQRTNEFGIRMALGAPRGHVLRIVFESTAISVGSGVLAGVALTVALNTIVARWTGAGSRDPLTLLTGVLLLSLVCGIACAIPASKAARLNPMASLRCE